MHVLASMQSGRFLEALAASPYMRLSTMRFSTYHYALAVLVALFFSQKMSGITIGSSILLGPLSVLGGPLRVSGPGWCHRRCQALRRVQDPKP